MKPFEGYRVLDLTHVFAGPFCTHQLAMLGADVIKIEPPDMPDMTRDEGVDEALNDTFTGTYFLGQNSGKRAITLDLRSAPGKDVMRRLIESADVLVQNYAGDALDRLGFGYEAAAAINPKLIYCSMTGYGRTGPKAGHPAYDTVVQAFSGLMSANVIGPDGPERIGPPMVDYGTGAQAALAVSAALLQRERTGRGQQIDVAMLDCALMLMTAMTTGTATSGRPPQPHGNAHPDYAGYRTFRTSDGLLMVGAYTRKQFTGLLNAVGETTRAGEVETLSRKELAATCAEDGALIQARMLNRSADDWEALLNEAHVPAARVRTVDETLAHEQVRSRGVMQAAPGLAERGGPQSLPVAGFGYAHGTPSIDRPPPRMGEHTDDVLGELGYSTEDIAALRETKAV